VRALRVHELIGPDGVRLDQVPEPDAGAGVRVAVHAAGVGFVDTLLCRGHYQVRPDLPFAPGLEVAGVVLDVPPGSAVTVGQPVLGHLMAGGFAETVVLDPALVAAQPAGVDHAQAAALVVNHQTAYVALVRRARTVAGERVLVHGAGGGLGSAAVQVAAALGGQVLAVAGSPQRRELAAAAGAHTVYGPDEWFDAVRAGGGADVIVDPVGGDVFTRSVRCLAPEGRLLTVGFTSGEIPAAAANRLLLRNAGVRGLGWRELLTTDPTLFAATAAALADLVAGGLRPLIGARYELADGAAALRAIEQRAVAGKVVLTVR
jgi:NADPH2:quinone reductase